MWYEWWRSFLHWLSTGRLSSIDAVWPTFRSPTDKWLNLNSYSICDYKNISRLFLTAISYISLLLKPCCSSHLHVLRIYLQAETCEIDLRLVPIHKLIPLTHLLKKVNNIICLSMVFQDHSPLTFKLNLLGYSVIPNDPFSYCFLTWNSLKTKWSFKVSPAIVVIL